MTNNIKPNDRLTADQADALVLIQSVKAALDGGTKHYRVSDNKLLTTVRDVITALRDEGSVELEFEEDRQ